MFGNQETVITSDDVVKHCDQLQVWWWLLGFRVDLEEKFRNPWRVDNSPGCKLVQGDKYIFFSDWASDFNGQNPIGMTMRLKNKTYHQACQLIYEKFSGSGGIDYIKQEVKAKKKSEIYFLPRQLNMKPLWLQQDKEFWQPFGITSEQLVNDKVYPVEKFRVVNSNGAYLQYPLQGYAISDFSSGHVKIYQPYSETKWLSNVDEYDIGGLESLPKTGEVLFICKSYKDWRINVNLGFTSVWIQGEHFNIPEEILTDLGDRFKRIYVYYDNDHAGISACLNIVEKANKLVERIQYVPLWLPEALYRGEGITDNGDYHAVYGGDRLKKLINYLTSYDTKTDSSVVASTFKGSVQF